MAQHHHVPTRRGRIKGDSHLLIYEISAFNVLGHETATVEATMGRFYQESGRSSFHRGRAVGADGKLLSPERIALMLKLGKCARVVPAPTLVPRHRTA